MKSLKKFKKLARKAIKIRDNQELTWKEKYDLVFGIVGNITKVEFGLEAYDPDTTYEEDVRAYVDAVEQRLGQMESQ